MNGYSTDQETKRLLAVNKKCGHFSLFESLIRYKNRIWVGGTQSMQLKICQALHSSAVGRHSGFQVTYVNIK
jgi:hypothetical protein